MKRWWRRGEGPRVKYRSEKGSGQDNGVDYTFSLKTTQWFASYECRVNRLLLDSGPMHMFTKWFRVGDRDWCMRLERNTEDFLAAYLYLGEHQTTATAHYLFTVVNQKDEEKNRLKGNLWTFKEGKNQGVPQLASLTTLTDPQGGFIDGDTVTVRLEIRIKLPTNEWQSMEGDDYSATFTWKLKDVWGRSPWDLHSDEFIIGDTKWQLRLHPYGLKPGLSKASIYLDSLNASTVKAKYKLAVNCRILLPNGYSTGGDHEFLPEQGWGSLQFLDTIALQDEIYGFLQDGWFGIVCDVSLLKLDHQCQPSSSTSKNDQDPKCIFCLEASQTSGIRHGQKYNQESLSFM